jgi:hypothetical protein
MRWVAGAIALKQNSQATEGLSQGHALSVVLLLRWSSAMRLPIPCVHCGAPEMEILSVRVEYRPDADGKLVPEEAVYKVRCPNCQSEGESALPPTSLPA